VDDRGDLGGVEIPKPDADRLGRDGAQVADQPDELAAEAPSARR
jgi:hypothetical protein